MQESSHPHHRPNTLSSFPRWLVGHPNTSSGELVANDNSRKAGHGDKKLDKTKATEIKDRKNKLNFLLTPQETHRRKEI